MENVSNGSQGPLEPRGTGSSLKVASGCLLSLLVLSTLLGNALVCLAVIRFRHLRAKVTNWFVLSLALSDLCVALLVMPCKAVTEVLGGVWVFGSRFCDMWVAFDIMCSTASILHLCIISLDRYWAIASPFRYERRMTQCLASAMIALAWTLSILISFIPVQLHWHKVEEWGTPDLQVPRCDARLNRTYAVASSLISFYIPVSIMIGTYTRIYRIAQAQIRRISSLERAGGLCLAHGKEPSSSLRSSLCKETKVLQTLSIIVGVFVCCWLPFFILNCLLPFCEPRPSSRISEQAPCISQTTFSVFMWLGWANSSVNPVIYAFNADFRQAFSSLLGCPHLPCWAFNSSAIERVNLSHELVSYHRDSSCHKSGDDPVPLPLPAITAWSQSLPHAVNSQGEEEGNGGPLPETEMLPSCPVTHRSNTKNLHLPPLLPFECEAEISLETIAPFAEIIGH
ncbi:D(1) dopamine receptor-like [Rhineura floridana]|uniref:D(1) dopamine receptor-like n=1 Tax=Rhineura floridana TaxID=261503 RepID=UPI002AC82D91|nr:D(1) dopamine receptor-like [Rhineura floridana]